VSTQVLSAEAELREAAFRPVLAGIDRAVLGERPRQEHPEQPARQERAEHPERAEHQERLAAPARAADHRPSAKPMPAAADHGRRLGHDKSSGNRQGPSARARRAAAVDLSQRGRAARDVLPAHTPRR
jgi:hypothetical protein